MKGVRLPPHPPTPLLTSTNLHSSAVMEERDEIFSSVKHSVNVVDK